MAEIVLFDQAPTGRPRRMTLPDVVASAFVRAGVGTPTDPALAGFLSAGGAIDASNPTPIALAHGNGWRMGVARVTVPLAAAIIAITAGAATATGSPIPTAPAIPAAAVFDGADQLFDGADVVLDGS